MPWKLVPPLRRTAGVLYMAVNEALDRVREETAAMMGACCLPIQYMISIFTCEVNTKPSLDTHHANVYCISQTLQHDFRDHLTLSACHTPSDTLPSCPPEGRPRKKIRQTPCENGVRFWVSRTVHLSCNVCHHWTRSNSSARPRPSRRLRIPCAHPAGTKSKSLMHIQNTKHARTHTHEKRFVSMYKLRHRWQPEQLWTLGSTALTLPLAPPSAADPPVRD